LQPLEVYNMSTGITFNSYSLQTSTIITSEIDMESSPKTIAKVLSIAHASKATIPYLDYQNKTIRVSGTVIGTSVSSLDSALDTFRSYFNGKDKNLDIDYAGSTRRYIATAIITKIDRPHGLLHANFDIEFACSLAFGKATSNTTAWSASSRTSASYTTAHTFIGTAPYQLPKATITYSSVPGGGKVGFGNDANGQMIYVSRTWSNSDILVIDSYERTVTVNGSPVEYTGGFPEFAPGAQNMFYSDTFSSRTFDVLVEYPALYL